MSETTRLSVRLRIFEKENNLSDQHLELIGTVIDAGRGIFKVQLEDNPERIVNARISGKMRKFRINLVKGDRVRVKVSIYDMNTGFIVHRL